MSKISDEDMDELREAFEHFDKDGNGTIDAAEFASLLENLGAGMSDSEVATGLRALDDDGNGTIEFEEFVAWWTNR